MDIKKLGVAIIFCSTFIFASQQETIAGRAKKLADHWFDSVFSRAEVIRYNPNERLYKDKIEIDTRYKSQILALRQVQCELMQEQNALLAQLVQRLPLPADQKAAAEKTEQPK